MTLDAGESVPIGLVLSKETQLRASTRYPVAVGREQAGTMHGSGTWLVPLALIYLTFFLDNVLLTVLVPIIPDWIRGEAVSAWRSGGAPLAAVINATVQAASGAGGEGHGAAQAAVGVVLSAKAGAQLLTAGPAAAAVCRVGAARVLRLGTALLLLAALVFGAVSADGARGWPAGAAATAARAAQGAGAALAGVAGLALAAATAPPHRARQALAALLGAVALGVLVGYPFGGATYALWSRSAPFLIISLALAANLLMQYKFLDKEEYNRRFDAGSGWSPSSVWRGGDGAGGVDAVGGAAAGAVLLTTSVMAALEPTLPLWIADTFHTERWVGGVVFVPDSAAYLVSATVVGAAPAGGAGARARLASLGVLGVALAALAIPHATSVSWLAWPHTVLGLGLGATDAALVPALLAPAPEAAPRRRTPHRAALIQAAASAAYVIGPVWGGVCSWLAGFPTTLRALGVANLLYAALLYRTTYTMQWDEEDDEEESASSSTLRRQEQGEMLHLTHGNYATLN